MPGAMFFARTDAPPQDGASSRSASLVTTRCVRTRYVAKRLVCPSSRQDVIVLSAGQNDRVQSPPDASVVSNGAESTARPACRGPPQVIARRRDATGTTAERRWVGCADASPDDLIVRDDLGPQIPISAAELEVIETYLGHLLHDLLASSTAEPDSDKG